jgi:P27 family predicted phage terminase small subunit
LGSRICGKSGKLAAVFRLLDLGAIMRGRKPIAMHLHVLRGNPSKKRLRCEPHPTRLVELPAPPSFLGDHARETWRNVGVELVRLGILAETDLTTFAAYCAAAGRWREAEELLAQAELPAVRVLAATAAAACREMVNLGAEFGTSPLSRSRLGADLSPGGVIVHDKTSP